MGAAMLLVLGLVLVFLVYTGKARAVADALISTNKGPKAGV